MPGTANDPHSGRKPRRGEISNSLPDRAPRCRGRARAAGRRGGGRHPRQAARSNRAPCQLLQRRFSFAMRARLPHTTPTSRPHNAHTTPTQRPHYAHPRPHHAHTTPTPRPHHAHATPTPRPRQAQVQRVPLAPLWFQSSLMWMAMCPPNSSTFQNLRKQTNRKPTNHASRVLKSSTD